MCVRFFFKVLKSFFLQTIAHVAGLNAGLKKMSLGERATIAIPPQLAFGDEELVTSQWDVHIPPGSIVVYDVVLLKVGDKYTPNNVYEPFLGPQPIVGQGRQTF
jgi:hypothetical protein